MHEHQPELGLSPPNQGLRSIFVFLPVRSFTLRGGVPGKIQQNQRWCPVFPMEIWSWSSAEQVAQKTTSRFAGKALASRLRAALPAGSVAGGWRHLRGAERRQRRLADSVAPQRPAAGPGAGAGLWASFQPTQKVS